MKKIYFVLISFIILISFNVNAKIMCNDDTPSKTCEDCHQGCCSGHGGCKRDANGNDIEYVEEDEKDNYNYKYELDDEDEEDTTTNIEDEKDDNGGGWLGYLGVGALAAAGGYAIKSRK